MKHVFSNSWDCLHVFAQRVQDRGRSSNVFFEEKDTAYSYGRHFPLAKFYDRKGKTVVLINNTSYSVTTSKHQSQARSALSHYMQIEVRNPEIYRNDHKENLAYFEKRILEYSTKAQKAVKNGKHYLSMEKRWIDEGNKYIEFFGIRRKPFKSLFNTKQVKELIEKQRIESAEERKAKREREERERKENEENRQLWLLGEYNGWKSIYGPIMLRLKDAETVETSKGATFPLSHAKLALHKIRQCVKNGTAWHRNGSEIRLATFHIDSINEQGTVKAGCHTVEYTEIERFAQSVGL